MNTNMKYTNLPKSWVTGFIDEEGSFFVGIYKSDTMKIGYQVSL